MHRTLTRYIADCFIVLYSFAVLGTFFCVADQAMGHKGLLPLNATILCIVLLIPFGAQALIPRPERGRLVVPMLDTVWANRYTVAAFVFVALVALLFSILPGAYWGEGGKWIAVIPYDVFVTIASLAVGLNLSVLKSIPSIVLLSLLLLTGSIWYDQVYPGTFAELSNRAAGFPGNANYAALVANILCAAALNFGDKRGFPERCHSMLYDVLILLSTFAVITMTMSRSGMVNFCALFGLFIFFRFFRSKASLSQRSREILVLGITSALAAFFLVWFATSGSGDHGNNRLARFMNSKQVDDGSAATRLAAVHDCIDHIERAPWLGYGTGFARTMHELPHNIYLQQWVNNGILGIGSYLVFLGTALFTFTSRKFRNGQAVIIAAAIGGIFSHNIIDQRPFLILVGILLSHSHLVARSTQRQLNMLRLPRRRRNDSTHVPEQFAA
jgi:O-antigen ligase